MSHRRDVGMYCVHEAALDRPSRTSTSMTAESHTVAGMDPERQFEYRLTDCKAGDVNM
jgi:hypothetical protein